MPLGTLLYALLWCKKTDLERVPTGALEEAFIYSAVAYEHGEPMVLSDALWDAIGLELLCRKDRCSIDFNMAINWDILRMKSTNLAIDFNSPMCQDAERCRQLILELLGG